MHHFARNIIVHVIGLFSLSIVLTACASQTTDEAPTVGADLTATPPDFVLETACLVTYVGTIDDDTFNEYAFTGLRAAANTYEFETVVYEPEEQGTHIQFFNQCLSESEDDADVLITISFPVLDDTVAFARAYPQKYFIAVDQDIDAVEDAPQNVVGLQFREDEAGYLVGALAALVAAQVNANTIAGIYGPAIPPVMRYRNGYEQGARSVNPDIEILGAYEDSFVDTSLGIAAADRYIEAGAAVIFGAGGSTGSAGIRHAAQQGVYVIGVDQDEYFTTFNGGTVEGSAFIISSALKRVDQGVRAMLSVLAEGDFESFPAGTNYLLDTALGGIGFAPAHEADLPEELYDQVSGVLQDLISGEVRTGVDPVSGELLTLENG